MNNILFQILLKHPRERTMFEKDCIAYYIDIATDREFKLFWLYETFFNKHEVTKLYN